MPIDDPRVTSLTIQHLIEAIEEGNADLYGRMIYHLTNSLTSAEIRAVLLAMAAAAEYYALKISPPKNVYTWKQSGFRDYFLVVKGQLVGSHGHWNIYNSNGWNAMGARGDLLSLPLDATKDEAKAAVIAAWEAQNEQ